MTDPVLGDGSASYTPGVSVRSGGNVRYQRTGLKLLGQGYCNPSTGRFLTRDPIKDGRNWYAYGSGLASPSNFTDPDGFLLILLVALKPALKAAGKELGKAAVDLIIETIVGMAWVKCDELIAQRVNPSTVHKRVGDWIMAQAAKMGLGGYVHVEHSRLHGRPINGRPKRSVVADVAIGLRSEPWGVLDWKSGRGMSKRTLQRYADTIITGRESVIVEVRRSGGVANPVRDYKGVN